MTQSLSMSRRGLIGVAGASVLGAPLLMARTATAQTNQPQTSMEIKHAMPPETNRFKLGNFEVLVVKDGARAAPIRARPSAPISRRKPSASCWKTIFCRRSNSSIPSRRFS